MLLLHLDDELQPYAYRIKIFFALEHPQKELYNLKAISKRDYINEKMEEIEWQKRKFMP